MATPILARTTTTDYRTLIDGVVTALRRAGAVRFDHPGIATAELTPAMYARLARVAERAVAMLDGNLLMKARAEALRAVLDEEDLFEPVGVKARQAIDAYEARVR